MQAFQGFLPTISNTKNNIRPRNRARKNKWQNKFGQLFFHERSEGKGGSGTGKQHPPKEASQEE